jgi:serine/threonine protein phosphatase PrpC
MRVTVGAASDIGQVREGNEDSFLVEQPLFVVADGMGGHRGGEVASSLALDTIQSLFVRGQGSLVGQVEEANRAVFERSQADRNVAGMGTTLTAALVDGDRVQLAHVGDSRAYLFHDHDLSLLTEDHTLVHRMVMDGEISEAEAEVHPHRSILTRALGVDGRVKVDESTIEVAPGDRVLLCTDGLTGMVGEEQIRTILDSTPGDAQGAVERLISEANRAGGVDNITAVVLDFTDDGTASEARAETPQARASHEATREQPVESKQASERASDITMVGQPPSSVAMRERVRTSETGVGGEHAGPLLRLPVHSPPRSGAAPRATTAPSRPATQHPDDRRRAARKGILWACALIAVVAVGLVGLRVYLDTQWFVGVSGGHVAVFRGVPAEVAGFSLHHVVTETEISAADAESLAVYSSLGDGITAEGRGGAEAIVAQIRKDVAGPPTAGP